MSGICSAHQGHDPKCPRCTATMPNFDLYDGDPEGFDTYSWSPTSQADVDAGKPQAPSTQVHLYFNLPWGRAMYRFKGPNTLDRLIAALIKHRVDVWGIPKDPGTWKIK